ncbi:MAG: hypothetical protein R3D56_00715 [Paracoccaceae bacterium]
MIVVKCRAASSAESRLQQVGDENEEDQRGNAGITSGMINGAVTRPEKMVPRKRLARKRDAGHRAKDGGDRSARQRDPTESQAASST